MTLRVEYLSHHLLDCTQTLDLGLNDCGRQPQVQRIEYDFEFVGGNRGKLRGHLECGSAQPSLFPFQIQM